MLPLAWACLLTLAGGAHVCRSPDNSPDGLSLMQRRFFPQTQATSLVQLRSSSQLQGHRGHVAPNCALYPGKRVVLATVNAEYAKMFKNWLHFAKPYLQSTEQLHVIAEEPKAVALLEEIRKASGVDFVIEELSVSLLQAPYDSKGYGALVWRRPDHVKKLLKQNCTVLYTDIDTAWKADPFQHIAAAGPVDMYLTDDDPRKLGKMYCTCFMYMQPTPQLLELMDRWRSSVGTNMNQIVFNGVLQRFQKTDEGKKLQLSVLPLEKFPPGKWADEYPNATVYHANWMVGIAKKTEFMQKHQVWSSELWVDAAPKGQVLG